MKNPNTAKAKDTQLPVYVEAKPGEIVLKQDENTGKALTLRSFCFDGYSGTRYMDEIVAAVTTKV